MPAFYVLYLTLAGLKASEKWPGGHTGVRCRMTHFLDRADLALRLLLLWLLRASSWFTRPMPPPSSSSVSNSSA